MNLGQEFELDVARRKYGSHSREQLVGNLLALEKSNILLRQELETIKAELKKHTDNEMTIL
jgi:hypothetical protein